MFEPRVLESIRPKGLQMAVVELPTPEGQTADRAFYIAKVGGKLRDGREKACEVRFSLPIPKNGVFQVNDLRRFVVPQGLVNLHNYRIGGRLDYFFQPRSRVIFDALVMAFDKVFTEFFMTGELPLTTTLQNEIDGWFKTSPVTQEAPRNAVGMRSLWELVHLRIPKAGLDISERYFDERWLGKLDPASTPSGDKVNTAYRMVAGASIQGGILRPGNGLFCSTILEHHMPVALCPRRTHISRSAYESAITLETYEDPIVGKPGLHGRHLLTAIMRFGTLNGDDAIVISQSAATKLRSAQSIMESFHAVGSFKMLIGEGDDIVPDQPYAERTDPITQKVTLVVPRRVKSRSQIKHIHRFKSSYFGVDATRVRLTCISSALAATGDKVFTRGAIKGVIRVVPDEQMPVTANGETIEAIVSPESVVGRRAMSVYWEGMANKHAQKGGQVLVDHFDPRPKFEEFVNMGYGDPEPLFIGGQKLSQPVWVAPIYYLRLDKIASQIVSVHSGGQALNGMRLPVDSAQAGGQKRDFAKGASMIARGMDDILHEMIRKDMRAPYALKELKKVLEVPTTPAEAMPMEVQSAEAKD
jgi:hypothetical protein